VGSKLVVGLDVGTTFCKAVVVDGDGVERAHGLRPTPWTTVPTGAEADPEELAHAAIAAVRDALAGIEGEVAAVGVTGMAETGVLLDGAGAPVAPAIAWHDRRGQGEAEALARELGSHRFASATGLPPTALCSLVKYRWLRDRHDGAHRGVRWLSVPEWVVRRLGGDDVAELSLASRTGMLDVVEGGWWSEALEWGDAPAGLLPDPVPAGTPAGRAGDALPEVRGAVLTVAGHDHLAAAVGAGAVDDGDVLDDCGTSEALVRTLAAPLDRDAIQAAVVDGITVGRHVVPGRMALLSGFGLSAPLARTLRMLGIGDDAARRRIDAEAAVLDAAELGVRVEGLLEETMSIRGVDDQVTAAHVWRAALEAAADASADALRRMQAIAGPPRRVVMAGGEARSVAVRAVREARTASLHWSPVREAAARGAALLAARAAGVPIASQPPVAAWSA
jgi:sugar (pentulose or hexulose) kinase